MKIGIVGCGHVGTAMNLLFPDAIVYDEPKSIGTKSEINGCDVVFVCVPTPMNSDGSCDTSIVEYVISWLEVDTIVLRSTVPVGFVDAAREKTGKILYFSQNISAKLLLIPSQI